MHCSISSHNHACSGKAILFIYIITTVCFVVRLEREAMLDVSRVECVEVRIGEVVGDGPSR